MSSLLAIPLIFIGGLGVPLFAIILAAAAIGFYCSDIHLSVLAIELYRITDSTVLMALPLFTFTGYLLSKSNTADRLVRVSEASLGWMRGGMVIIGLLTCAFFTMLTGGSGVTIVALGGLLYPALVKSGYSDKFSLGLITTSGSLGLLLPPAIPLLLYGIIAQQLDVPGVEIIDLYKAGALPFLLMITVLFLYGLYAIRHKEIPLIPFNKRKLISSLKDIIWEAAIPVVVILGVGSGILVISEVAAVIALYVLIIEVFVYKDIKIRQLPGIMKESMVMVGGILLILGCALAFTNFLVDAQVPDQLFRLINEHVHSKVTFLILLNILLLFLGAILDIFAALVIMVPLILPVSQNYGVDPIHLGIIFVANMQIGYFTPPVGMNLFLASYRFNKSITQLYAATLPFMAVLLLALLFITYVPWLSLVFVR
ncbi:TRAP transporter large permease subunit [Vibrio sp. 99-8-1]|uniref:TRAP transporter large permease n=1 Tax=Vibrio sp. 99-8-1 TaxID=2607602 RepID=UPI0014938A23|nr:TRAP transporter large permease subunit [Vibrio sp. 99-8-1]NOI67796.1 TRAP transporter large permease subunit [Vibrio sp. 99-8-1]